MNDLQYMHVVCSVPTCTVILFPVVHRSALIKMILNTTEKNNVIYMKTLVQARILKKEVNSIVELNSIV